MADKMSPRVSECVWQRKGARERTGVRVLRSGGRRHLTVERVRERETGTMQQCDDGFRVSSVNTGSGYYSDVKEVAELGCIPPPQPTRFYCHCIPDLKATALCLHHHDAVFFLSSHDGVMLARWHWLCWRGKRYFVLCPKQKLANT